MIEHQISIKTKHPHAKLIARYLAYFPHVAVFCKTPDSAEFVRLGAESVKFPEFKQDSKYIVGHSSQVEAMRLHAVGISLEVRGVSGLKSEWIDVQGEPLFSPDMEYREATSYASIDELLCDLVKDNFVNGSCGDGDWWCISYNFGDGSQGWRSVHYKQNRQIGSVKVSGKDVEAVVSALNRHFPDGFGNDKD